jgi:hypothetical protein
MDKSNFMFFPFFPVFSIFSNFSGFLQLAIVRCENFIHNGKIYKDCREDWPVDDYRKAYTVSVALLIYFIPLSILMFTYMRVARILWQRTQPGERPVSFTTLAVTSSILAEERRMKSKQRVSQVFDFWPRRRSFPSHVCVEACVRHLPIRS